jgi:hypothetical protein
MGGLSFVGVDWILHETTLAADAIVESACLHNQLFVPKKSECSAL